MTLSALVNPSVLTQPVYEPGKPIDDVARELGLDPAGILKLASNENPLGPCAEAAVGGAAAQRPKVGALGELAPGSMVLRQTLAKSRSTALFTSTPTQWGLKCSRLMCVPMSEIPAPASRGSTS
jgi:histidinol-phosphate aminotransferase